MPRTKVGMPSRIWGVGGRGLARGLGGWGGGGGEGVVDRLEGWGEGSGGEGEGGGEECLVGRRGARPLSSARLAGQRRYP